jgi:primosomal replication protein N
VSGGVTVENRLVIEGIVQESAKFRTSPAGIPIGRFTISHQSEQHEAGLSRPISLLIGVVASGRDLQPATIRLQSGDKVRVEGFLSRARYHDTSWRLVLHANTIDMLDSNEPQSS